MKVSNVEISGLESSIRASKFPMSVDVDLLDDSVTKTVTSLATSGKGEGHDQFLTGCTVSFDLTCTNKMWVEMERYRFVYFVSSQSTMHRASKFDLEKQCNNYVDKCIIRRVEEIRQQYLDDPTPENYLTLLYNLPSGFELTARLVTNYRALKTVYAQRKDHRLPEWREFCKWIETLPNSEFITGKTEEKIANEKYYKAFNEVTRNFNKLSSEGKQEVLTKLGYNFDEEINLD